jgi:hypothetical protein
MSANTPVADPAANSITPSIIVLPVPEYLAAAFVAIGVVTERAQEAMDFIKANKLMFDNA